MYIPGVMGQAEFAAWLDERIDARIESYVERKRAEDTAEPPAPSTELSQPQMSERSMVKD